jgi:hypothetical protein
LALLKLAIQTDVVRLNARHRVRLDGERLLPVC